MFQTHLCEFFCEALRGHDLPGYPTQNSRVAGVSRLALLASRCHTASRTAFLLSYCVDLALANFYFTTFSDGCLGSINDEGRSEVR